jgi:hypothetical protein
MDNIRRRGACPGGLVLHVSGEWGVGESLISSLSYGSWSLKFSFLVFWGGVGYFRTNQGPFIFMAELVWETFFFYLEYGPRLFEMDFVD